MMHPPNPELNRRERSPSRQSHGSTTTSGRSTLRVSLVLLLLLLLVCSSTCLAFVSSGRTVTRLRPAGGPFRIRTRRNGPSGSTGSTASTSGSDSTDSSSSNSDGPLRLFKPSLEDKNGAQSQKTNNNNSKKAHLQRTQQAQAQQGPDSIASFSRDITTVLKELRSEGCDPTLPSMFRNINMPSFTNIWSQRDWDLHTSRWRYLKYLLALPTSRLLRRLAPQLTILVVWACAACWMCSKMQYEGFLSRAVLPLAPLSLVSTFVAALLTLRSNQGLGRLNEGRLAFGKVVLYTRDMAQLIATVIYPRNHQLGILAARHVSIFGWLLKDFLRHYDEDYTKPLEAYKADVCHDQDIVQTMLPVLSYTSPLTAPCAAPCAASSSLPHRDNKDNNLLMSVDATFILAQRKRPVATCTRLRQIFAFMQNEMTTSEQSRLDACAQQLNKCVMVCERIIASPIPPLYTAHAGRLLIFYLFFLPLALRGSSMMNNLGTILTTTVVGYAMLGLDEISHILEQPFRLMPLYHLSKNSMKDCADAFVNMPPSLPIESRNDTEEEEENDEEEDEEGDDDYDDAEMGDDDDGDTSGGADQGETSSSSSSPLLGGQNVPAYW